MKRKQLQEMLDNISKDPMTMKQRRDFRVSLILSHAIEIAKREQQNYPWQGHNIETGTIELSGSNRKEENGIRIELLREALEYAESHHKACLLRGPKDKFGY